VSSTPEMGELDPAVAARLEEVVVGHQLEHAELDEALKYRDQVIALASERMRRNGCPEEEIQRMVSGALDPEVPPGLWIDAMRGDGGNLGPWDD
jgi:hypothetical protein